MFERGVIECFRNLSWNYKTNQPFKFGKRLIFDRLVDGGRAFGYPSRHRTDELNDLMRVFHIFDGKPENDHRSGIWYLIMDARNLGKTVAENDYFIIKWFKKGSGHVKFKRLDLVDKLNAILAKHYPNALAYKQR
jgi:Domain of unknown function (DUF4942)